MSHPHRWAPGDPILLRGVWRGRLWWAIPVTVVHDEPDLIALYWPANTPNKIPETRVTPRELLSTEQVDLVDKKWVHTDVLMLVAPGAAHAVYAMWDEGHSRFRCWYINLQDPLCRARTGFDTSDHLLDIVVSPDRSEWHWKDEDEFAEAVKVGLFSSQEARAIRVEGKRAIRLLQAGEPPFRDGWAEWSPPPEWAIPGFPEDWDRLAVREDSLGGSPWQRTPLRDRL